MADGPSLGRSHAPIWGSAFLALGASTGAMAAHALEGVLTPERLGSWETASLYLLVMGAALVGAGSGRPSKWAARALAAVAWGTALFSTSIFALVVLATVDAGSGVRAVLGPLTPVGGVLMIGGWIGWLVTRFKTASNDVDSEGRT